MDFNPVMVNITLSPSNRSSQINVEIINDSEIETIETFTLRLTSFSSDIVIDTPNANVTIVDDDSEKIYPISPNSILRPAFNFHNNNHVHCLN